MNQTSTGMPHLPPVTDEIRRQLILCIDAGAASRQRGEPQLANPHLNTLTAVFTPDRPDRSWLVLEQVEAWWRGWDEIDAALRGPRDATEAPRQFCSYRFRGF